MTDLWGLISLSPTDPAWKTTALLVSWGIGTLATGSWVVDMMRRAPGGSPWRRPWRLPWPWCLTWWLGSVATVAMADIVRVSTIGHIRNNDWIGQRSRDLEVLSAVVFAFWSILAYWRWRHPANAIDPDEVFHALAVAMPLVMIGEHGIINYTTPAFDDLVGAVPDELVGLPVTTLMPRRYQNPHLKGFAHFLATGEGRLMNRVTSLELLRRDGTEVPVSLALTATRSEGRWWIIGALWERNVDEPEGLP